MPGRERDRVGVTPLARAIVRFMDAKRLTAYDDLAKRAAAKGVDVSGELFRKAATDGFEDPIRRESAEKLAAGLDMTADEVHALDFQRVAPKAFVAHADPANIDDVPDDVILAEAARRLAARNPDAKR